ncbi:hypothetical protein COU53_03935 [Candidatus Pacearchaeota archaeon CG10_big_fil_rev_8_21_14_0_10_30_48]|nr:MAG: hypothetical protein COU53_03935 [Candidatus Pacearchaeota archaeon CG10_big_fil_rev_8_21_14_0_10_30_48]
MNSEKDPLKKLEEYSEEKSNKRLVVFTILGIIGIVLVIAILSVGFLALRGGDETSTALDLPEQTTTTTDSGSDDISATVFPSGRGSSGGSGSGSSGNTGSTQLTRMGFFADFFNSPTSLSPGDIYYKEGNVGIGTDSPLSLLQVNGSTTIGEFTSTELDDIFTYPTILVLKDIRAGGNTRLTLVRGNGRGTLSYGTDGRIGVEGFSLDVKGEGPDFTILSNGDTLLGQSGMVGIGGVTPADLNALDATGNPVALVIKDVHDGGNTRLTLIRGERSGTLSYGTDGRYLDDVNVGPTNYLEGLSLDVKGGESDFKISKDGNIYLKNLVATGSGKFLCIEEDTGKIYRSVTACA